MTAPSLLSGSLAPLQQQQQQQQQQAKFPIGRGPQPFNGGLADSVTSLNLSHGSNASTNKPAADPRAAATPPAPRVSSPWRQLWLCAACWRTCPAPAQQRLSKAPAGTPPARCNAHGWGSPAPSTYRTSCCCTRAAPGAGDHPVHSRVPLPGLATQAAAAEAAGAQVKLICNSGGHFVRLPGGAFEYQGGETRLVSVHSGCSHKELLAALDRVMACPPRSRSSDTELVRTQPVCPPACRVQTIAPWGRCRLPSGVKRAFLQPESGFMCPPAAGRSCTLLAVGGGSHSSPGTVKGCPAVLQPDRAVSSLSCMPRLQPARTASMQPGAVGRSCSCGRAARPARPVGGCSLPAGQRPPLTALPLQGPQLRFQLPHERNTYVDLVDGEDVQLMFDEWADFTSSPGYISSAKLQVRGRMRKRCTCGERRLVFRRCLAVGRAAAGVQAGMHRAWPPLWRTRSAGPPCTPHHALHEPAAAQQPGPRERRTACCCGRCSWTGPTARRGLRGLPRRSLSSATSPAPAPQVGRPARGSRQLVGAP